MNRYSFDSKKHIHFLDGSPLVGTTTALSIMDKPGLTWWASGMACAEFGWLNPRKNTWQLCFEAAQGVLDKIKVLPLPEYLDFLNKAYRAHNTKKEKAADDGTNLHAEVERYIKGILAAETVSVPESLASFHAWCTENVERFLVSEVHCYSERLWCGGIVDFAYIDKKGNVVLADVKSSPKAYFSHFAQMGAYDIQLFENGGFDAAGNKVFELPGAITAHAVFHFGEGFTAPTIDYNVGRNCSAFENALALYRASHDYENFWKAKHAA